MTQESNPEEGSRDEPFIEPPANDGSQETPTIDPSVTKAIREEIEQDIIASLVDEDTESPIYKGMQRVVAGKDRELAETRREVAALKASGDTGMTQLQGQGDALEEEVNFLREKLVDALPEEEREKVRQDLLSRRMQRIEAENKELRESRNAPAPQPGDGRGYEPPQGPSALETQLLDMQKEATKDLRSIAKDWGIDPDHELLEYGDETNLQVGTLQRSKGFMSSLKKAQTAESTGADGVRPKGEQTKTRTSGGGSVPAVRPRGETLLGAASAEYFEKMQRATPGARKR